LSGGSAALASEDKSDFVSGNSTFSDCGGRGSDLRCLLTGDLEVRLSTFVEDGTRTGAAPRNHPRWKRSRFGPACCETRRELVRSEQSSEAEQ
jgi:hypothetical protein